MERSGRGLIEGTGENHDKTQGSRCPERDLNSVPPEYKGVILTSQPGATRQLLKVHRKLNDSFNI
jgi:hypothetical protein